MTKEVFPFTVIFYEDGDYRVETYVEHVWATDSGDAFDKAVAQVEAGSNATEIVTFSGHLVATY